jgi:Protein of unknown function (DUF1549)/Protein of unknown function (DUF1553)
MVRYLLAVAACALSTVAVRADSFPVDRPIEAAIDHYIDAKLAEEKAKPAPLADDATLLRRLMLDLAGRVPTAAELDAYLADTDPAKKTKLVDRLLAAPAFARHQTNEFAAFFDPGSRKKSDGLAKYLAASFAENKAWDKIFREMMLPDAADPKQAGAGEFLSSRIKDLNRVTIDVSTRFFGVNVSCAQCHNHPLVENWTQDHFYGLKSFFARTVEATGGVLVEKDFGSVKYVPNKKTEKVSPVMFLTGKPLDVPGLKEPNAAEKKHDQQRIDDAKKTKKSSPPTFSLRAKLVDVALARPDRGYFARSIVNRLWYRHMGLGLVMPLDQMHTENPPTHPELLDWLATDLAEHGYDLRRLVRGIVLSKTYARSSRQPEGDAPDEKLFAVARVRPLTPAQMSASLKVASTDPATLKDSERIDAIARSGGLESFFPALTDNFQVGVAEAMLFANNDKLSKELLVGSNSLAERLAKEPTSAKRAELAVRTVLARPATSEEIEAIGSYLDRRTDRSADAYRQVVWALLATSEFRFNH